MVNAPLVMFSSALKVLCCDHSPFDHYGQYINSPIDQYGHENYDGLVVNQRAGRASSMYASSGERHSGRKEFSMNWIDEQYQRERRADLLREIHHKRMIYVLQAGNRLRLYHTVLASIGRLLVRLGIHLQQRSDTVADVTISVTTGKISGRHHFYN